MLQCVAPFGLEEKHILHDNFMLFQPSFIRPDGSGETLASKGATIRVQIVDSSSVPVPGIAADRITLRGAVPSATARERLQALAVANDTDYGLSGYVWGGTREEALQVARRLRTGMVHINGADNDIMAPFGGYRQSGNGREWGRHGIEDFQEIKAVMGA